MSRASSPTSTGEQAPRFAPLLAAVDVHPDADRIVFDDVGQRGCERSERIDV